MAAGVSPANATEVNVTVGTLLRAFTDIKEGVTHHHDWLAPTDLKQPPYEMSAADETLIKSAINGLFDALEAVDMTFIARLTGIWT